MVVALSLFALALALRLAFHTVREFSRADETVYLRYVTRGLGAYRSLVLEFGAGTGDTPTPLRFGWIGFCQLAGGDDPPAPGDPVDRAGSRGDADRLSDDWIVGGGAARRGLADRSRHEPESSAALPITNLILPGSYFNATARKILPLFAYDY